MKIEKKPLLAAVALAVSMGSAGQAAASVYAGSSLDINQLGIAFFDSNGILITNVNPNFTFNIEDSATLDGVTQAFAAGCDSIGGTACGASPVLGINAANGGAAPAPVRANNDYALFGPGSGDYANSNAEITSAQLVTATPTHTQQVSEAELDTTATTGQASTNIQSNTTFTMNFTLTQPGPATMGITFLGNPEMQSLVNLIAPETGISQANMNTTLTLNSLFSNAFATWSPQGTAVNDCAGLGVVCTETADGEDLNRTLGTGPANSNLTHSLGTGATSFGLQITGLQAGDWSLTLAALTSVSVVRAVPEPGLLMLLGSGFAFGAFARRKQRRANNAA